MQEICRRLKPKELEDLAALNALYRPGPLDGGMVDDFIDRHRGDKKVRYIVPEMKDILMNTYGILGLSGTDHAVGTETRRIQSRRSRYDAPGDGQEKTRGDGGSRGKVYQRGGWKRHKRDQRRKKFLS